MPVVGSYPVARHHTSNSRNRVMIVDDHPAIRRALSREFERAGWEVCGDAANGHDAITKAEELLPDVIVLDLAMPEMNGLTTARVLKRTCPEVHLILFTGHGDLFDGRSDGCRNFCSLLEDRAGYPSIGKGKGPGWNPRRIAALIPRARP